MMDTNELANKRIKIVSAHNSDLSIVYPDISKTAKYEIISEYYHFFFTYRRFKDKLDEYNASKKKYLLNRNLL